MTMIKNMYGKKGLTSALVLEKQKEFGKNEIQSEQKLTLFSSFVSQFNNFLTILLIFAGSISFLLGEKIDSLFIFLIIILNALFGVYQEFKAEKALESLKKLTTSHVRVFRDDIEQEIDSKNLVPGDIVFLEEGSKVPADGVIFESMHLEINEAALTGESLPVEKEPSNKEKNQLFLGTIVSRGRCKMEVTNIGSFTKFGKIAITLGEIEKGKTPLQKKLEQFTKQIGIIGISASVLVFILSFIREKTLFESFLFAVSLAVAAVPEGLPAVMTITLAIGTERMAQKKAIIRKLNAIEALGSVTVVATDKTGTLTTNKMTVKKIWVDDALYEAKTPPSVTNHPYKKMLENGILCSTATLVSRLGKNESDVLGDTTEGALLLLSEKEHIDIESIKKEWEIIEELSFNSITKRMSVVVKHNNEELVYMKGAPESVLSLCNTIQIGNKTNPLSQQEKIKIENNFRKFASEGLRMLAFAWKPHDRQNIEKNLTFIGFVGISDPVRPDVDIAVRKAHDAGIRVVMITGDNELTAEAVGVETGIIQKGDEIVTGKQIDKYSDKELSMILDRIKIFARTTPEHKYRLVKLYQSKGEVVSVTGDGVNDALALKQADVGVAMGMTGTDVAKETADMIITDDNFATIINAIEYGRNIFNQIKNAIKYLLACNLGEVIYVTCAVVFGWPVMTPLQILYINIATDGLPALCLAFAPRDKSIMHKPPRRIMSILELKDMRYLFFIGISVALLSFASTIPFQNKPSQEIGSILFSTIVLIQPLLLMDLWISHRSLLHSFALMKHPAFIIAFLLPFLMHPILLYSPFLNTIFKTSPLSIFELIDIGIAAGSIILIFELTKVNPFRRWFHE
jgi:P-type Ca2+ transporter type 2C